jgi:hypothetical protein
MMSEIDLKKQMDELIDELLQTRQEMKKLALMEKIKQIYEELNRDDRPIKRDPYWLTDNCDTISCIELTMQHDKRRYVKGWMEGEPRIDEWDGSTDNQIMIHEDKEPERRLKGLC